MKSILILEDDLAMQRFYIRILGNTHKLTIAGTIAEAKSHVADPGAEFDLFVSDMRLPDGIGSEAVCYCQQNRPSLPIFVVSGTLDDAADLTVNRKFEKPRSLTEFLYAVSEVCNAVIGGK